MDASSFVLSGDFGYVVLVMIFSVFMLMWMGGKVGGARKKYEVPVSYSIIILHFNRHDSHLDYILIQNTKLLATVVLLATISSVLSCLDLDLF